MKHLLAAAAIFLVVPATAQEPVTPTSVVADASAEEWTTIASEDLLVMELAPDERGDERTVVIQLIPPPFSQPWVENVRTLAEAHWWDGTSVYRVQDNYVTQWGDVTEEKELPEGVVAPLANYTNEQARPVQAISRDGRGDIIFSGDIDSSTWPIRVDNYADHAGFYDGWPIAGQLPGLQMQAWPIHCYGTIGVARDYAPDTGTGSELYTIIGQPQRHMDRNLAVVGRVIEGMEHLSSLPRGHGELGFYAEDEEHLRTPIVSVRLASELPDPPSFEYLDTDSESFARYVQVRANRNDPFYTVPAGGVDVCSVQVPVRRVAE